MRRSGGSTLATWHRHGARRGRARVRFVTNPAGGICPSSRRITPSSMSGRSSLPSPQDLAPPRAIDRQPLQGARKTNLPAHTGPLRAAPHTRACARRGAPVGGPNRGRAARRPAASCPCARIWRATPSTPRSRARSAPSSSTSTRTFAIRRGRCLQRRHGRRRASDIWRRRTIARVPSPPPPLPRRSQSNLTSHIHVQLRYLPRPTATSPGRAAPQFRGPAARATQASCLLANRHIIKRRDLGRVVSTQHRRARSSPSQIGQG